MTSLLESERTLREECSQLVAVLEAWPRMIRNLQASLPGFPSSTTGSAPSSGQPELDEHGDPVSYTAPERVALHPDAAREAFERVHVLIKRARIPLAELYSLAREWGFDAHQAKLDPSDTEHDWCTSCLRIERCEPRDKRYAKWCRWCGQFVGVEGRLPSVDLLLARHQGKRITRAMIDAEGRVRPKRRAS